MSPRAQGFKMKVYIVLTGEAHEGGHVEGVYMQREDAVKMAKLVRAHFPSGWKKSSEGERLLIRGGVGVQYVEWASGCDWVSVEEHEVCP